LNNSNYYEKYWSKEGFCPRGRTTPELANLLQKWIKPGWKCLDFGCGDGSTAGLWLRNHGCDYVGVDVANNASQLARDVGLEAVTIDGDGRLPFESDSFDAAVCIEVMEHMFTPQVALSEVRRVLRRHGTLLVTVPNCAYWRRRMEIAFLGRWNPLGDDLSVDQPWRDPHIRFFTCGSLKRLLRSIPLDVVEIGGHGGSLLRDTPYVGKWLHRAPRFGVYQILERSLPSLFGYGLHGIAQRQ
jgi:methionine biosynthesis protein MetW